MSTGLIALLDDIAGIAKVAAASVDDIASQAAKAGAKAAGVVIDDAAVTPRYVVGFKPEQPIVNKLALAIRNSRSPRAVRRRPRHGYVVARLRDRPGRRARPAGCGGEGDGPRARPAGARLRAGGPRYPAGPDAGGERQASPL